MVFPFVSTSMKLSAYVAHFRVNREDPTCWTGCPAGVRRASAVRPAGVRRSSGVRPPCVRQASAVRPAPRAVDPDSENFVVVGSEVLSCLVSLLFWCCTVVALVIVWFL